jgi:broad specificity phosphatase PhoE
MGAIFLLRHGETELTPGYYTGSSDPPLNARGREQAERIRDFLAGRRIAAIYSSPLRRAVESAQPSAQALGLPIVTMDALREVNFGAWEGLTFEQARERYPEQWAARDADPYSVAPPRGETYADLAARVIPAFADLVVRHASDDIAVFGHKSVNRVLVADVLSMPVAFYRRIELDPGALIELFYDHGRLEVTTVNDCCHLGLTAGDEARWGASS